jgi:hypothetical protein
MKVSYTCMHKFQFCGTYIPYAYGCNFLRKHSAPGLRLKHLFMYSLDHKSKDPNLRKKYCYSFTSEIDIT